MQGSCALSASTRLAVRQERSAPIIAHIDDWLAHYRARASAKSPLGEALAYIAKYRDGLLLQQGGILIILARLRPLSPQTGQIRCSRMGAPQEPHQIGRREENLAANVPHG